MAASDSSSEANRAMMWVKARGMNILPSIPWRARMGMKVRAMMSSPKIDGLRTSRMALRTVVKRRAPAPFSERCLWTFSTWMMVASMIMPSEMARPPSDMRLADRPEARIMTKVKRIDSGRASRTMKAPRKLRRKRSRTTTTSREPTSRASVTVWMARPMMSERW